jgi:hypothetical protein
MCGEPFVVVSPPARIPGHCPGSLRDEKLIERKINVPAL